MAENDVDQSPTLSLIHDRICVVHLGPVYFLIHGGPDLVDICHVNLNKMATNLIMKYGRKIASNLEICHRPHVLKNKKKNMKIL